MSWGFTLENYRKQMDSLSLIEWQSNILFFNNKKQVQKNV